MRLDRVIPATALATAAAAGRARRSAKRRTLLRNAYFGDLRAHTGLSFDAAGAGTQTMLEDAHQLALGEEAICRGRRVRRKAALDFLAVTDPSEHIGMALIAVDPSGPLADADRPAEAFHQPGELAGRPIWPRATARRSSDDVPATLQERAWTSPIFHHPQQDGGPRET